MKRKNKIIIFSMLVMLILISTFFFSYGFFHTKILGNETSKKAMLSSQTISVEFSDGTESLTSSLNDNYFYPGSTLTKTFTITNTGSVEAKYSINLNDIVNDFVRVEDLTYELKLNDVTLMTGIFPKSDETILKKETLTVSESKTYVLTIKYLESTENQIIDNGKIISGNIKIDQNVKYIASLKIYGNSLQDGTPTPTNPIEIKSLGENSKNILSYPYDKVYNKNGLTITTRTDGSIQINGTATSNSYFKIKTINLENGKIYTLSGGLNNNVFLQGNTMADTFRGKDSGNGQTITITDGGIMVYFGVMASTVCDNVIIHPQLEEGSTPTEYRPHKYIDVVSSGKNLFDGNFILNSTWSENNGVYTGNNNYYSVIKTTHSIYLKAGIPYTISFNLVLNNNNYSGKIGFNDYSNEITFKSLNSSNNTATITPNVSGNYYIYFFGISRTCGEFSFSNLQIEEGNKTTEYEPYQKPITTTINLVENEPLRQIGDVADYIDYKEGKIIRKIKKIVFDGTENWSKYVSVENHFQIIVEPKNKYSATSLGLVYSNYYIEFHRDGSYFSNIDYSIMSVDGDRIRIKNKDYLDVTEWKNYIANLYEAGKPLTVYYVMETPIEEPINIPNVDVHPFTNNIKVCDNLICSSKTELETE